MKNRERPDLSSGCEGGGGVGSFQEKKGLACRLG